MRIKVGNCERNRTLTFLTFFSDMDFSLTNQNIFTEFETVLHDVHLERKTSQNFDLGPGLYFTL